MNNQKTIEWPLLAIHRNGETLEIHNADDLKTFFKINGKWSNKRETTIPDYCRETRRYLWKTITHDWIMRDLFGRKVSFDDASHLIFASPYHWLRVRNAKLRAIAEKGLPIPHTGCRKAGRKQNAPGKKNSGRKHRLRNQAKANYDIKIHNLPGKLRVAKTDW